MLTVTFQNLREIDFSLKNENLDIAWFQKKVNNLLVGSYYQICPGLGYIQNLLQIATHEHFEKKYQDLQSSQLKMALFTGPLTLGIFLFVIELINREFKRAMVVFDTLHPVIVFRNVLVTKRAKKFLKFSS